MHAFIDDGLRLNVARLPLIIVWVCLCIYRCVVYASENVDGMLGNVDTDEPNEDNLLASHRSLLTHPVVHQV